MAWSDNSRKALALVTAAGTAVAAAALGRAFGSYYGRTEMLNTSGLLATLAVAKKWARVFHVPVATVLAVIRTESNFHRKAENHSDRAEQRGGAWGLMQVTKDTARDLVKNLVALDDAEVKQTLAKATNAALADALLDADFNVMLGAYYLSKLAARVGAGFDQVVTAYHQGPGPLVRAAGEGKPWDAYVGPLGREYLATATKYHAEVAPYAT